MYIAPRSLLISLSLTTLFAVPNALAQAPASPPPPPAREGTAEFAFVATSGNASTETLGLGGDFTFRPSAWTLRAKAAFVQSQTDGTLAARSITSSFRTSRQLRKRVDVFGQFGYLRDRFAGIVERDTADAGVTIGVVKGSRNTFAVDLSLGYAHERRDVGDTASNGVASIGTRYTVKLSETAEFANEVHLVQSLSQSFDTRADYALALTAKLTTRLSLKLSNTARYIHKPVAGFAQTDTITSVALVAKF